MESLTQHFLPVQKTARVFTLGKPGNHITEVWLVLHGYAQLAQSFIEDFGVLKASHRLIVAPEGQNYFYAKGFGGKPASAWMTSEMREYQITDYVTYLNHVCETFIPPNCKLVLLGFSQGVATASRWLHQTNIPVSRFIVYSGELAAELQNPVSPSLLNTSLVYVTGTKDPLISAEKLSIIKLLMASLNAELVEFEGGHEITSEVLTALCRTS